MNIAELFVKLGIKGGDKTLNSLQANQKAFKGTASMALEAKAAIFGAVYALQSLFRTSNAVGSDLTNFNAALGISAKTLQQYQYAARQVGVDNKAVEQSFRALQQTMTKALMGEGAPKGLARVAQLTGDITPEDLLEFSKSPDKLLQRLQEYAAREKDAGFRNEVLKSFGIGDDMIAALSRKAFRLEILQKAPTYSDSETKNLDKANVAWSNLGNTIEMAVGKLNAKYGVDLVKNLEMITKEALKLTTAFIDFAKSAHVFEVIGMAIKGWTLIFQELKELVDYLAAKMPDFGKSISSFFSEGIPNVMQFFREELDKTQKFMPTFDPPKRSIYDDYYKSPEMLADRNWGLEMEKRRKFAEEHGWSPVQKPAPMTLDIAVPPAPIVIQKEAAVPRMPYAQSSQPAAAAQNITVNQQLTFEGSAGTDIEKVKRVHAQAVQQAMRQIPAQSRSN